MLHRLLKPWFVYRPTRVIRRAVAGLLPLSRGYKAIGTSWGVPIIADASRTIGRSISTTGIYDIAVSEALARLISPGDTVVAGGANIGYMTVLASVAAGPGGRVLSFEPHPSHFAVLQRNVGAARERIDVARTELHQLALGDRPGTAALHVSPEFDVNDGTARICEAPASGGESIPVRVDTLDSILGEEPVGLLKLDVEGFEPQVLRGSSRALMDRRIRHIVFEDHYIENSELARILGQAGYHLFSLGWSLRGVRIQPIEMGSLATRYEAANYIATFEPDEVQARCSKPGWLVLRACYELHSNSGAALRSIRTLKAT